MRSKPRSIKALSLWKVAGGGGARRRWTRSLDCTLALTIAHARPLSAAAVIRQSVSLVLMAAARQSRPPPIGLQFVFDPRKLQCDLPCWSSTFLEEQE